MSLISSFSFFYPSFRTGHGKNTEYIVFIKIKMAPLYIKFTSFLPKEQKEIYRIYNKNIFTGNSSRRKEK